MIKLNSMRRKSRATSTTSTSSARRFLILPTLIAAVAFGLPLQLAAGGLFGSKAARPGRVPVTPSHPTVPLRQTNTATTHSTSHSNSNSTSSPLTPEKEPSPVRPQPSSRFALTPQRWFQFAGQKPLVDASQQAPASRLALLPADALKLMRDFLSEADQIRLQRACAEQVLNELLFDSSHLLGIRRAAQDHPEQQPRMSLSQLLVRKATYTSNALNLVIQSASEWWELQQFLKRPEAAAFNRIALVQDIAPETQGVIDLAQLAKLGLLARFTSLDLTKSGLGNTEAEQLAAAATAPGNQLEQLFLGRNRIGNAGALKLAQAVSHPHSRLQGLNLNRNRITEPGLMAIGSALEQPTNQLTNLGLGFNTLGPKAGIRLAAALTHPANRVTTLGLSRTQLGAQGVQALVQALSHPNNQVEFLHLSQSELNAQDGANLALTLASVHNRLRFLDLKDNQLKAGLTELALALQQPANRLRALDVGRNSADDNAAGAFALSLMHPQNQLQFLGLAGHASGTGISDVGAIRLAAALGHPTHNQLQVLDLSGNLIRRHGAQALATSLKLPQNRLTSLALSGNRLGAAGSDALAEALEHPHCKLTTLELGGNEIGSLGAQRLAHALEHTLPHPCRLQKLDLNRNRIGNDGARALARALRGNPASPLRVLDLSGNWISPEVRKELQAAAPLDCQIIF